MSSVKLLIDKYDEDCEAIERVQSFPKILLNYSVVDTSSEAASPRRLIFTILISLYGSQCRFFSLTIISCFTPTIPLYNIPSDHCHKKIESWDESVSHAMNSWLRFQVTHSIRKVKTLISYPVCAIEIRRTHCASFSASALFVVGSLFLIGYKLFFPVHLVAPWCKKDIEEMNYLR